MYTVSSSHTHSFAKPITAVTRLMAAYMQQARVRNVSCGDPDRVEVRQDLHNMSQLNRAWHADLARPLPISALQVNTGTNLRNLRWIGEWTDRNRAANDIIEPIYDENTQTRIQTAGDEISLIGDTVHEIDLDLCLPVGDESPVDLINQPQHYHARAAAWMAYTQATQEQLVRWRAIVTRELAAVKSSIFPAGGSSTWWTEGWTIDGLHISARIDTDGTPLDAILALYMSQYSMTHCHVRMHMGVLLIATACVFGASIAQEMLAWMGIMHQFQVFPSYRDNARRRFFHTAWWMIVKIRQVTDAAAPGEPYSVSDMVDPQLWGNLHANVNANTLTLLALLARIPPLAGR